MASFLQWNCRGYFANYEELKRLLVAHQPLAVCLQELQLRDRTLYQPSRYREPLLSVNRGASDRGGAAILLHESVPFTPIPLSTPLHAVAARIHLDIPLTLCSVYLAPSCPYTKKDLIDLFRSLPPPMLVLGDFNLRHPLWGDSITSPNAGLILDILQDFSLGCLNTGLPTFERFDTGTSSCVDISLCSLSTLDRFGWDRSAFLCGSDHYPIVIPSFGQGPRQQSSFRWQYNRADWSSFYQATYFPDLPSTTLFPSPADAFSSFQDTVLSAAADHIPRSSGSRKSITPWWNQDCARADREKRKLFRAYKQAPIPPNLILFKASAARARCIYRRARKQYFRNYASTVNSSTPVSAVH